jgi:hypothetical protein
MFVSLPLFLFSSLFAVQEFVAYTRYNSLQVDRVAFTTRGFTTYTCNGFPRLHPVCPYVASRVTKIAFKFAISREKGEAKADELK